MYLTTTKDLSQTDNETLFWTDGGLTHHEMAGRVTEEHLRQKVCEPHMHMEMCKYGELMHLFVQYPSLNQLS
jgi:hypothetical protein